MLGIGPAEELTDAEAADLHASALRCLPALSSDGAAELTLPARHGRPPVTFTVGVASRDARGEATALSLFFAGSAISPGLVEEALRSNEQRLRRVLGATSGLIFEFSREGRYLNVWTDNEALLPRPSAELLGRTIDEVHDDEVGRRFMDLVQRVHATGLPAEIEYSLEVPRGNRWFLADACRLEAIPPATATVGFLVRDITERKLLEKDLVQADRMAMMGTLIAGVAHEINNPLSYVVANLDFLTSELSELALPADKAAELDEVLSQTREGVSRITKVVRDLRLFARTDEEEPETLDLHQTLEAAIHLAWATIKHRATLIRDLEPVPTVLASRDQLGQVFLHLLLHAAGAHSEGNSPTLEIHLSTRTDAHGRAVIEVRDSGPGIDPKLLDHLFEPFSVPRPAGVGTGFGLSICHGIVTTLGGTIRAENLPGRGSVFTVVLPPHRSSTIPPLSEGTEAGPCRILVVDDEPSICRALVRLLGTEHQVTAVTSAGEALELLQAGCSYHLLVCDLMMPGMSGMELYAELGRVWPEHQTRVLFLTGGAPTPAARAFLASREHLTKPFDAKQLLAVVRERLSPR